MLSIGFAAACSALSGCSETFQRLDGVTPDAGDAIAANTVMQMVDPWQYGVQNTRLLVPAPQSTAATAAGQAAGAKGAQTTSSTTSD
jgi:hypothetical protein